MNKVYMLPTPTDARKDDSNAIHQCVIKLDKYLPAYGWQITENRAEADLIAGHAGQTDGKTAVDVAHCHGLYPTASYSAGEKWTYAANEHVIRNLRDARQVTVPSEWVADILRRDMHINPSVIGWAIDHEDWEPGDNQGYVLWNKTRDSGVCDPTPLLELAKRFPQQQFVTTFGEGGANVKTIGRQHYAAMQGYIKSAAVYLATTRETYGIGTLEPMACGIPILGYAWAGTQDLVTHGLNGYLAQPGNIDDLQRGLEYCLQHRAELGANAREAARRYTWDAVAQQFADVYNRALQRPKYKLSVVIPVYNYERYVGDAIQSVLHQQTSFDVEIVVVDDCSTDNSRKVARDLLADYEHKFIVSTQTNGGPARARNTGISLAQGEYILTLDADDMLYHDAPVLQTLADALDAEPGLGIAYTGLMPIGADGEILKASGWPGQFDFEAQIARRNQVPTCCMFRREAWRRTGGYKTRFEPAEDAELWLHMTSLGYRARKITDATWFVYRMHPQSLSNDVRQSQRSEPNWVAPHVGWIQNGHRPFAAPVRPQDRLPSNPVRDYDQPEISVVIPVGPGHGKYLPEALDSINAQTYWNWEAVVVFDCLPDDVDLPGGFWDAYPYARFYWTEGGKGPGYARNIGAQHARGRFLTFLDADDWLHPEFLEATYAVFRATGRYVYTDWLAASKSGELERHECPNYDPQMLFRAQSIHAVSVLIPKMDFDAVGGFAEDMGAWEDVELYMKLAAAGYCGERLARPLLVYRYTTGNLREHGETIKDELRQYLADKYRPYITGEKMCSCEETLKNRQSALPALSIEDGDVIRVRMDGPRAPAAKMQIIGPATKQSYGRRGQGDVFLIKKADLSGMAGKVTPYTEFDLPSTPTSMPEPPQVMETANV